MHKYLYLNFKKNSSETPYKFILYKMILSNKVNKLSIYIIAIFKNSFSIKSMY